MEEKIDWYKVSVLSWAKKNQHICWEDHVKAEALAMARETRNLIGRFRAKMLAKKAEVSTVAKGKALDAKKETQAEAERFMPHAEARRVPSFMLRRKR